MNYKEKYNEALEKAKKNYDVAQDLYNGSQIGVECFKNTLTNIFPELKESEDERIRKWCISHFNACINVIKDNDEYKEYLSNKVIAWLEKQGEKKPTENAKTLNADKVIAWLVANICDFEHYVKLFKKDFGL